jgi:hypothetical protein
MRIWPRPRGDAAEGIGTRATELPNRHSGARPGEHDAMATLKVPMEVVDTATGLAIESRTAEFGVMPPEDQVACTTCGRRHDADQPHDAQSLHYQYAFRAEHDRWPTWKDAVAHCTDQVRTAWETELRARGHWPEP